jgi:hypothetical protein
VVLWTPAVCADTLCVVVCSRKKQVVLLIR